jgi:signal transduction histidine kinase
VPDDVTDDPTWRSVEVEAGATSVVEDWLARAEPSAIDTARCKRSVRALLTENARLRSVLGHCPKGIGVLDEKGNLTGHNRELTALLGVEPTLGEPMEPHFAETDRALLAGVVKRAGTTRRAAAVLRTVESSGERDLEFLAATLPSSEPKSIGVVLAGEDRSAAIVDETARRTLDDANRVGAWRLGTTATIQGIEAFRAQADAALDRGEIEKAREALRALAGVLGRRPEAKRSDRRCEVGEVARRAARLSSTGSTRRDAAIHVEIDETIFAGCDAHDLAQVLANVLDNAVHAVRDAARFGCVTVHAARVADRDAIEIVVNDDGVGIDPHRLQRIFDPHETTRDDGALGVGLAVARALVESFGGSIRALSEPGRGTTMIVEVPEAK